MCESILRLYVAPNGNDQWSGSIPAPNPQSRDGPLATLERARNRIREVRRQKPSSGTVVVQLRGGIYELAQPLVLSPEDSGSHSDSGTIYPVVYEAYPGEQPILSGGRRIEGWQRAEGELWKITLPAVKQGDWYFRQLFLNGRRCPRTRYPVNTELRVAGAPSQTGGWAANLGELKDQDKRTFRFTTGDLRPDWRHLDDVEVVVLQFWTEARLRIAHLDEAAQTVIFTGGSWRPLTWSFGYYVENLKEGLATPGTWYLDCHEGALYYHPRTDEVLPLPPATAPRLEQLVRLEGDPEAGQLVRHVTFRGLSFQHTAWNLPTEGYNCPQAEIMAPAAFWAEGAEDCRVENCEFTHLGGWGLELAGGCCDNIVRGNQMRDLGAGGLKVGLPSNRPVDVARSVKADISTQPPHYREDHWETCRTTVEDNRFLEGSQVFLGSAAVWVGQSGGNRIRHNEFSGAFHWAISLGWNWGYFPLNRARDNLVEYNHIHHLGTGILGTHGAIYALGVQPGTVIRNNYIHHIFCNDHWGAGEGIILDNGCAGILIENNVVHDAIAGGWGCNFNNFGNIIQNNIFAYGRKFQLTRYGDAPPGSPPPNGEIFAHNLVVWKEGPLFPEKDWWSFQTLWNYNLYFQTAGEPIRFLKYSFAEWQAKGLDTESIIADPQFTDPAHGDFSLRPESPAFALGFKPIDLRPVGPRTAVP